MFFFLLPIAFFLVLLEKSRKEARIKAKFVQFLVETQLAFDSQEDDQVVEAKFNHSTGNYTVETIDITPNSTIH